MELILFPFLHFIYVVFCKFSLVNIGHCASEYTVGGDFFFIRKNYNLDQIDLNEIK